MSYDLTPNKIFSKSIKRNFDFFDGEKKRIPWEGIERIPYERKRFDQTDSLFWTGTIEDIKFKKEMFALESANKCECCGMEINRLPWSKNNTCLCDNCLENLHKNVGYDIGGIKHKHENPELTHPWWFYI